MELSMFELDASAQLTVISGNLTHCPQTEDTERQALTAVIESHLNEPVGLGQISRIQDAVRTHVLSEGLYFLGRRRPELTTKELLSTQTAMRFEQNCAVGLRAEDPALTVSDAHLVALRMVSELEDDLLFVQTRDGHSSIHLHRHGTPMWLADPDSVSAPPESAVDLLPSRLGLAPRARRYVLLFL